MGPLGSKSLVGSLGGALSKPQPPGWRGLAAAEVAGRDRWGCLGIFVHGDMWGVGFGVGGVGFRVQGLGTLEAYEL